MEEATAAKRAIIAKIECVSTEQSFVGVEVEVGEEDGVEGDWEGDCEGPGAGEGD